MARSSSNSATGRESSRTDRKASSKRGGVGARRSSPTSDGDGAKEPGPLRSVFKAHAVDLWAVAFMCAAVVSALSVYASKGGALGRFITTVLGDLVGWTRYLVPPVTFVASVLVMLGSWRPTRPRLVIGLSATILGVTGLADLAGGSPAFSSPLATIKGAGGYLGLLAGKGFAAALGEVGAVVVLLAVVALGAAVMSQVTFSVVSGRLMELLRHRLQRRRSDAAGATHVVQDAPTEADLYDTAEVPVVSASRTLPAPWGGAFDGDDDPSKSAPDTSAPHIRDEYETTGEVPIVSPIDPQTGEILAPLRTTVRRTKEPIPMVVASSSNWALPSPDLLSRTKAQRVDERQLDEMGDALVSALRAHSVDTSLVGRTVGPTVTRFELEIGPGVKVARVTSLSKDIAYAMASPDVRILAPIPGRSAIGVEVPNRQRQLVSLGDILASTEAKEADRPLDVALGRDIAGRSVLVDLAEMPHVLISGSTGSGKSSCINSLITSVLMRSTPDQVRLMLIDPKRVELGQYNGLPHLLTPVVVDPKKAANALAWAVKEMERRYDLLSEYGVRDITSYTESLERGELRRPGGPSPRAAVAAVATAVSQSAEPYEDEGPEALPYILVVVDELNDLMMVAARDVEDSVCRIAQMARAVGIHLVLATQRPSVDVITGVIKANIPSRMAFSVSSLADSRVILDQPGAERLVGKGDMLLVSATSSAPRRLQAPWVSESEVRSVVAHWQRQGGQVEETVGISSFVEVPAGNLFGDNDDDDALLEAARRLVVEHQLGSTSMLQRRLRVGFARAGRLMDLLEQEGVVGPSEGSKARVVLVTPEQLEGQLG